MKLLKNKLFQFIILAALMVLTLDWLGRIYWCACGQLSLWTSDVNSSHNSQHLFDAYSFSHFQHGIFFYIALSLIKLPYFFLAVLLEAAWEVLENTPFTIERYRAATFSLNYYGDSIFNSLGDLMSCTLGYYVTSKLPWKLVIAIYVIVEAVMLITIRDSLTINVIMLIHPLDSIKALQTRP